MGKPVTLLRLGRGGGGYHCDGTMLVIEEARKAMLARNFHNMIRLGVKKGHIRSANTMYSVHCTGSSISAETAAP